MDSASRGATALLQALLSAREAFGELVNGMRVRPGVLHARPFLRLGGAPFCVQRGALVEEFVSAISAGGTVKHSNNNEIFWLLDICWTADRWTIFAAVEIDRDGTIEVIRDHEPVRATTLADCLAAMDAAIAKLRADGNAIELLA